jgi:hypothetical protein
MMKNWIEWQLAANPCPDPVPWPRVSILCASRMVWRLADLVSSADLRVDLKAGHTDWSAVHSRGDADHWNFVCIHTTPVPAISRSQIHAIIKAKQPSQACLW